MEKRAVKSVGGSKEHKRRIKPSISYSKKINISGELMVFSLNSMF